MLPKLRTYNTYSCRESEEKKECTVCNELKSSKSVAHNYGVQCCSGCKSFFRRVCKGEKTVKPCLSHNGACKCDQCRFNKCLARGMNRNYLREDNAVGGRRRLITAEKNDIPIPSNDFPENQAGEASGFLPANNVLPRDFSMISIDIPIPSNDFPENQAGETSGFPPADNILQRDTVDTRNEQRQLHYERRGLRNSQLHGKSQEVEYQRKQCKELDRMTNEVKQSELRRKKKKLNDLRKNIDNIRKLRDNESENKENELENFDEADAVNEFLYQRGQNQELNNLHQEIDYLRIVKQTADELCKLHKVIDSLSKLERNQTKKLEKQQLDFDKQKADADKEFHDIQRKRSEELKDLQQEIDHLRTVKASELEERKEELQNYRKEMDDLRKLKENETKILDDFDRRKANAKNEFLDLQRKQSEELKNLQQEIDHLRTVKGSELEERKEELQNYRKEIDDLSKLKQNETKILGEQLHDCDTRKANPKNEFSPKFSLKISSFNYEKLKNLQREIDDLEIVRTTELKERQGELQNYRKEIDDLRKLKQNQKKELEEQLNDFDRRKADAKNEFFDLQRKQSEELNNLQQERKKGEEELLALNDKKKALESEILHLQKIQRQAPSQFREDVRQVAKTKTKKDIEELALLRNKFNDLQLKGTNSKYEEELDSFTNESGLITVQKKAQFCN